MPFLKGRIKQKSIHFMVRLTIRFVCVKNDKYHVLCITRDGLIWLGCHDFFKKNRHIFKLFYHFIKGNIGPKYSQMIIVLVRLGGRPPYGQGDYKIPAF